MNCMPIMYIVSSTYRCHQNVGGMAAAKCTNQTKPDALPNRWKFHPKIVDAGAALLHRWFEDDELGMCRVVEFGGISNNEGTLEPIMWCTHVDEDGDEHRENSSLVEVKQWVQEDEPNIA